MKCTLSRNETFYSDRGQRLWLELDHGGHHQQLGPRDNGVQQLLPDRHQGQAGRGDGRRRPELPRGG